MSQKTTTPSVTLGQYKGLAVTRRVRTVSEKTIDIELVHQTRTHAFYTNSDAPAKCGNRVILDFEGFMDGEPIPDSKMEKVMVVLGDGKLMPEAEKEIYGHHAGETFRFDFTYPENFRVAELSGKTAQFEIKLHSVAEKHIPELNEEFAKKIGYDSLAAMREAVRKTKQASHEANADRIAQSELLNMAGANCTVELPADRVKKIADNQMACLTARLKKSGMALDTYCKNNNKTQEQLYNEYFSNAERSMRGVLAAKAIAEAEGITVAPIEINAEYQRLSQLHETPEAEIRKVLSPESISASIAARKVQEFLLANAVVTTVTAGGDEE